MAYKITDECISCGACEPECKNEAIREGDEFYEIDSARCTECIGWGESPACAEVCPTDSCIPDPAHEEPREHLLERWRMLFPGKTPAAI